MHRYVLIGDAQSPHLLKWARALAGRVELWVASSRGFDVGFDAVLPAGRRLALQLHPRVEGGNLSVLRALPRLGRWLKQVDADWIHAHYLSSHGTLAWLARRVWRLRGALIGSAWGSDILVAPQRSVLVRALTRRVLRACVLTTSDSQHMAECMRALGAGEVMVFPFGLEALPLASKAKQPHLFYANRGLEALYAPMRVLELFGCVADHWPDAELVVANDGSLRIDVERWCAGQPWASRVRFVGRLHSDEQQRWYAQAQWYVSLPESDSVSVSALEAMASGCIPILSDLPANHELVRSGRTGLIVEARRGALTDVPSQLERLLPHASAIADTHRAWVQQHALFAPSVERFLSRLAELEPRA